MHEKKYAKELEQNGCNNEIGTISETKSLLQDTLQALGTPRETLRPPIDFWADARGARPARPSGLL